MKKLLPAAMMLSVLPGMQPQPHRSRQIVYKERPEKECLHCGLIHNHNNSYCSAECCKAHRDTEGEVK